jgi:hypothetical protein
VVRPQKEPTETVRMAKSAVRQARILAAVAGKTLPDYLTDLIRQMADVNVQKALAQAGVPKAKKS